MEGRGEFKGAAGKKCLGEVPKPEGLRDLEFYTFWLEKRDTEKGRLGVKKGVS